MYLYNNTNKSNKEWALNLCSRAKEKVQWQAPRQNNQFHKRANINDNTDKTGHDTVAFRWTSFSYIY